MKTISFVGVGRLGAAVARQLRASGFRIAAIHDADTHRAKLIADEVGAVVCGSLEKVPEGADAVFTAIPDDDDMNAIFGRPGADTLLGPFAKGMLFVNCGTVSPKAHAEAERRATTAGADVLELCFGCGPLEIGGPRALLIAGGTDAAVARARPALDALGRTIHAGPIGAATRIHVTTQLVAAANTAALAEGLALGVALGINPGTLREVFAACGAGSCALEHDAESMVRGNRAPTISAAHAAKDCGIALALAKNEGLHLPIAKAAKKQFDLMVAGNLGGIDRCGVAQITFKDPPEAPEALPPGAPVSS